MIGPGMSAMGNGNNRESATCAVFGGDSTFPATEAMIYELLGASLIHPEDWSQVRSADRVALFRAAEKETALALLVRLGLLTEYQSARISAGNPFGLVLGNYRVLDRLGAGGMAVVFRAEHLEMRHQVAVKVLHMSPARDRRLETRFSTEMRTIARLRHPNIVTALDAGRAYSPDPDGPVLWYLVMEYVPGHDLDDLILSRGALPVARACNLMHQVASALAETHKCNLVHRDIKPSNVLVTPEDQAKLLDFGLSRRLDHRQTQPGTVLGTLDFMAPEQARDASSVDVRADIYGLGGTLYWCLTGELPFPDSGNAAECLIRRLTQEPPSIRKVSRELPAGLDAVVRRMMALKPEDRYQTPEAVTRALLPFLKPGSFAGIRGQESGVSKDSSRSALPPGGGKVHRVLIVDDEEGMRLLCREVLAMEGLHCDEAGDGPAALTMTAQAPYDLVLLDVNLPGQRGTEVLRALREEPPAANLKVIMFSGHATADEMSEMLLVGADDYIAKPFSVMQLQARVQTALRLKDAQDRSDRLNQHLLAANAEMERSLSAGMDAPAALDASLGAVRSAMVLALARLAEQRSAESAHPQRMRRYCRALAEAAAQTPAFAQQIDEHFIEMLCCCAPLHDIGKVALPDHILLKPGKLTSDERLLMQAHTTIGAGVLEEVGKQHEEARAFVQMAGDVIRHHHERFDGNGYPDGLKGAAIPLAARIVTIADVYDALRSRRSWKPALAHAVTLQLMTEGPPGQFDPALLKVFLGCAAQFDRVFQELPG
jgi:response regulator RpfG family c-di-GMP phosphodiesterase/serine/threonine protein kinase